MRHRVVDNYHCDGLKYESRVSCHEGRVYGYVSVFKRHYAKHFDFSNYKRMECVISSGHEAAKANITVCLLTQRPRNQPVVETFSVVIKLKGTNLKAGVVENIWGFYEQFPSVSVYVGEVDPSLIFGHTLCFIGDVTTEDTMGSRHHWSGATDTKVTCTVTNIWDGD